MSESVGDAVEAVVLRGPDGAVYAIPEAELRRWRLSEETAHAVLQTDEVSGYIIAILIGFQALGTAQFSVATGRPANASQPGAGLSFKSFLEVGVQSPRDAATG
jgi:hypothetical protein